MSYKQADLFTKAAAQVSATNRVNTSWKSWPAIGSWGTPSFWKSS